MASERTWKPHRWPIYDGESVRVLQERGIIPWTDETNALADHLDKDHGVDALDNAVDRLTRLHAESPGTPRLEFYRGEIAR